VVPFIVKAAGFSVNEQIGNALLPASERFRELREEFDPMARQKNSPEVFCRGRAADSGLSSLMMTSLFFYCLRWSPRRQVVLDG
jgi:hypothetical protein